MSVCNYVNPENIVLQHSVFWVDLITDTHN